MEEYISDNPLLDGDINDDFDPIDLLKSPLFNEDEAEEDDPNENNSHGHNSATGGGGGGGDDGSSYASGGYPQQNQQQQHHQQQYGGGGAPNLVAMTPDSSTASAPSTPYNQNIPEGYGAQGMPHGGPNNNMGMGYSPNNNNNNSSNNNHLDHGGSMGGMGGGGGGQGNSPHMQGLGGMQGNMGGNIVGGGGGGHMQGNMGNMGGGPGNMMGGNMGMMSPGGMQGHHMMSPGGMAAMQRGSMGGNAMQGGMQGMPQRGSMGGNAMQGGMMPGGMMQRGSMGGNAMQGGGNLTPPGMQGNMNMNDLNASMSGLNMTGMPNNNNNNNNNMNGAVNGAFHASMMNMNHGPPAAAALNGPMSNSVPDGLRNGPGSPQPSPSLAQMKASLSNTGSHRGKNSRQNTPRVDASGKVVPGSSADPNINEAMEKLCESMRRSAMSRNLVKQLSGRSVNRQGSAGSLSRSNSGVGLRKQISGRSLSGNMGGMVGDDGSGRGTPTRTAPIRRLSDAKHRIAGRAAPGNRGAFRANSMGSASAMAAQAGAGGGQTFLQLDDRSLGAL